MFFLCFYLLVFILYAYLAQQLHEMNTSCTKLPPILCHCCLLYLLAYYAMWANSSKSSQPHENDWKWRSCSKQVLGICLLGVHGNVTILMLALGKSVKQTINFHRWCGFSMFFLPAECRPPPVTQKTGKHILFNFVFWNPLWASKTTFSLKEIVGDWSILGTGLFYWPNVFSLFLFAFFFVRISSSNFVSLLPALLASLLCHVGQ